MRRSIRISALAGLLAAGVVVGWLAARITVGEQATGQSLSDRLLLPVLREVPGDVIVDFSGLPAPEREVAERLTFRAAFVRGSDLEGLGKFLGARTLKHDRTARQIYLVVCLETRENTGPRLMSLTMEVVHPERLAGTKIRVSGGLLDDDCVYHVEQVVDTDTCLPGDPTFRSTDGSYVFSGDEGPSMRDEFVRSRPKFRIVKMHIH
jgi:hypothetical protein